MPLPSFLPRRTQWVPPKAEVAENTPAKAGLRADAQAAAILPAKANTMSAVEAEVAANVPAKTSARAAVQAAVILLAKANTMGAAEAEVAT